MDKECGEQTSNEVRLMDLLMVLLMVSCMVQLSKTFSSSFDDVQVVKTAKIPRVCFSFDVRVIWGFGIRSIDDGASLARA